MTGPTPFEQLVLPHLDAAYNLARWLARDAHDAQDIVQEACARALRHIHGVRGSDAKPWFLTIVRHAFYDWRRRNRHPEMVDADDVDIDAIADAGGADPVQALQRRTEARVLADAVAQLPLALREVLILREFEDLSYKQIALMVEIPIGTVMSRLARARAQLQRSPLLHALRPERAEVHHGMR